MTAPHPVIPAAPMNAVASSSSPPPPTPSDALLAPGFRFHPTDEELVIYYLKRRVSGRPLRVDAIAEVDLYKTEPWDLPTMSRLRSRDMEWYFFSPLDRKYSNRSRTNRATAQGYWKTTGKDRPVRHGPRAVGMKKTLVFHVGRAPHGQRTNWVMHEYRLEDEELTRTGISQDGYVVCRIFQKNGSGPQNGAQYGAPFVEEEWDGADELVLAIEGGGDVATNAEYLQLNDFEHNQDEGNQHESPLTASSDGQNNGSHPEDPFLLGEIFQDESFDDGMNAPLLQDTLYNSTGGISGPAVTSHSPPSQGGFMELNDLGSAVNVDYPSSEDSVDYFLGTCNVQMPMNGGDGSNNLPKVCEVEEFFNEDTDSRAPFHMCPTVEYDSHLEPNDLLSPMAGDYPPDQTAEDDMLFYDAPSLDLPFDQDKFVQMDDLQFSPMADSSGFNLVDDIMAYFDSTDNLHYSTLDSSEKLHLIDSSAWNQSNFSPEVDGSVDPTYKATPSEANVGACVPSSVILPKADNQSNSINENVTVQLDSSRKKGYIKKFTGGLQNMLGAISAPPAHASQPPAAACKSLGQASTANVASSIHVTTGMIQIHGFKVMGSAEHWSLRQSGDVGFRLTCGMARDGVVTGPDGLEPVAKMRGWTMSVVLRGGFYLFFLLAMFLAVGFKAGMLVCSR